MESFFDMPIKMTKKRKSKLSKWHETMITRQQIFLDYEYFSKHHKLFAIDLCKQIELEKPWFKTTN